jgi:hypothetical protein
MKLETLKSILEENRFYTREKTQDSTNLYPSLEVLLDDEESQSYVLQLGYIPDPDQQFEHVKLLQFFVPVQELSEGYPMVVHQLLHRINQELALPGFSIDDDTGLIYYRYILPVTVESQKEDPDAIIEVLYLVFFFISKYADSIITMTS